MGKRMRLRWGWLVLIALVLSIAFLVPHSALSQEDEAFVEGEEGEAAEAPGFTLWQTILAGGWVMLILLILSIGGVYLIVDFFMNVSEKKVIAEEFVEKIKADLDKGELGEAVLKCEAEPGILSDILRAGIINIEEGFEAVQRAVQSVGEMKAEEIMERITYLSVIGTISPMLGLLGTVLGMIRAFNVVAFQSGLGNPELLAVGISQALITTAGGLMVAIPMFAFYFYFRGRGDRLVMRVEAVATNLIEKLRGRELMKEGG